MIKKLVGFASLFNEAVKKGILLFFCTILAMILANSKFQNYYHEFFEQKFALYNKTLDMSLQHWINEFLMAIFFLLVGAEIKRELIDGALKTTKQRLLPATSALFGVLIPICIYILMNFNDSIAMKGWAIPAATDIAFAIGIFSFFAKKLPIELRVFLTAVAIVDDLISVLIIAIFYNSNIDISYLLYITLLCVGLATINRLKISNITIYMVLGLLLWYFFYKSGIHSTVSGVVLALFIPLKSSKKTSPIVRLEQNLSLYSQYFILPLFALANAGISVLDLNFTKLNNFVVLGITFGLFFGKIIGIFFSVYFMQKIKKSILPKKTKISDFFFIAMLCGIGFTMSLFIAFISFDDHPKYLEFAKLGILLGSSLAIVFSCIFFFFFKKRV